ncbi:MAG: hypothetical protein EOP05_00870 [Proteobacteria bacterium]|nr:MAG: hypothetical protein EOP05_00870 [Pseudomonadota bacterium]
MQLNRTKRAATLFVMNFVAVTFGLCANAQSLLPAPYINNVQSNSSSSSKAINALASVQAASNTLVPDTITDFDVDISGASIDSFGAYPLSRQISSPYGLSFDCGLTDSQLVAVCSEINRINAGRPGAIFRWPSASNGKVVKTCVRFDPDGGFVYQITRVCSPLPKPVEMKIDRVRFGQIVFDPSISDGAGIDLVALKPFAAEVQISATYPIEYKDAKAYVEITIDGVSAGRSVSFPLSSIENSRSRMYIYHSGVPAGSKNVSLRVLPETIIPGVFDTTNAPFANRLIQSHAVNLQLLTGEINGCASVSPSCFSPVSASNRQFFETQQYPLISKLFPVSNVTRLAGANITSSIPINNSVLSRSFIADDMLKIWVNKKLAKTHVAAYLVSSDYFMKNGQETSEEDAVYGLALNFLGVSIFDARMQQSAAHEILHALRNDHSSDRNLADNIGPRPGELYLPTSARSLDPSNQPLDTDAVNIMAETPARDTDPLSLDRFTYNATFKKLTIAPFDPPVVLITGRLDANNDPVSIQTQKAETNLDDDTSTGDVEVRGLNASGDTVISVRTVSISRFSVLSASRKHELPLEGSVFAVALPDDGTITAITILKNGITVVGKKALIPPISTATLKTVISGLSESNFRSKLFAKSGLALIRNTYALYEKEISKGRKLHASLALVFLRLSAASSLKSELALKDGSTISLTKTLKLIDDELFRLRK